MPGLVIPGVLQAVLASQMERIFTLPTSCFKKQMWGLPWPWQTTLCSHSIGGRPNILAKENGVSVSQLCYEGKKITNSTGSLGATFRWEWPRLPTLLQLRRLVCFSLKPKNISEQISMNVTALRFKIHRWELIGLGLQIVPRQLFIKEYLKSLTEWNEIIFLLSKAKIPILSLVILLRNSVFIHSVGCLTKLNTGH